jgi:ferric-dicitrate binding protein FerR (iron transport regulator)
MNEPTRLEALLRKYFDGAATPIEACELDVLIKSNREAAQRFAEMARLDANLSALLKGERDIAQTRQTFERAQSSDDEFEPMPPRPRRSWIVRHRWFVTAASIVIAAVIVVAVAQNQRATELGFARIENIQGAEEPAAAVNEVLSGEALVDGKRVKTIADGALIHAGKREPLRIRLADGSETVLAPATSAVIHGQVPGLRQFIELLEGSAFFKVDKGDAQFQIETPRGRVTVLGTEFDLNLIKNKLIVSVLTGVVQVDLPSKPPLILTGGDLVEFSGDAAARKVTREMRVQFLRAEANQLTASAKGLGKEVVFHLVPNAEISINGRPGRLSEIPAGTVLVLITAPNDKMSVEIVRAEGQTLAGELRAVDLEARTIVLTVKSKDGSIKEVSCRVADDARITLDGKSALLKDLRIFSKVMIEKSLDGNTAVSITAGGKKAKQP